LRPKFRQYGIQFSTVFLGISLVSVEIIIKQILTFVVG